MKLSIVVVNYNVKYFLQQLLLSIQRSQTPFDFEVIVVDNQSTDGSKTYIPESFPDITYLYNAENEGFAAANNRGIELARGQYILILNPDTVLEEDTLIKALAYLDKHADCGALGVRMIDGSGAFLPESKRGFPTPLVAFFKAFGINEIFPQSSFFNRYYLGHLSEFETHEVDVLTGAFMMVRKSVLEEVGCFDDDFFMYGEDIDLSYRIKKAGYKLMYLPDTSIIHFKGESTQKTSLGYIRSFYGAMILFARKHFGGSRALVLRLVLQLAIYLKALITFGSNIWHRYGLMALEFGLISISLILFARFWAQIYFKDPNYYAQSSIALNVLIYSATWLLTLLMVGAYDDKFDLKRMVRGWIIGWISVAIMYAFFGSALRPSRFIVFAAGPIVGSLLLSVRTVWHLVSFGSWPFFRNHLSSFAIVGDAQEADKVLQLLDANRAKHRYAGRIAPALDAHQQQVLGPVNEINHLAKFHHLDEIIFCARNVSSTQIMSLMTRLGPNYKYKIAPDQALTIIGSSSKNTQGEWFTFDVEYQISTATSRRNKRIFDVVLALLLLVLYPLVIWLMESRGSLLTNIFDVLKGKNTWVSYASSDSGVTLPALKQGLINAYSGTAHLSQEQMRNLDFFYARDYTVWKDVSLAISKFRQLGNPKN